MSAPAATQAAPPSASPTTRQLLATLRATLRSSGAPDEDLREVDAWAVWVVRLLSDPQHALQVTPTPSYDAARECLAEVSSRVVRACAGVPIARREALLSQVAAGERLVVAYLDQYMLQRGRRR